jgi:hypothetical protein
MASQIINHVAASGVAEVQESSTVTVAAGEKVNVRFSRFGDKCKASLKIDYNSVITYEQLWRWNTLFDSLPENAVVSVLTDLQRSGQGVEGIIESF